MENIKFQSIDEVDDISSLDEYQVCLDAGMTPEDALKVIARNSRDNARTPFQWTASKNAGFTEGTPWLRVNPNYTEINLESQHNDPNSVFTFYKQMIQLRKNPEYKEAIIYGATVPVLEDVHNLIAFKRQGEDMTLLVLANFQTEAQTITLDTPYEKVVFGNDTELVGTDTEITLKGYQAVILKLK